MPTSFGKKLDQMTEAETNHATDILFVGQLQEDGTYDGFQMSQANITKKRLVSKTASYTITAEDEVIICDATAGAITLNLPTAVGIEGVTKTIVKIDNIANVTIDAFSSQTINGSATNVISSQYGKITIISDGANWIIIG